jgi:cell division protease FtsH
VIFTADVEDIFGKRQWTSRTDEILALNEHKEADATNADAPQAEGAEPEAAEGENTDNTANNDNNEDKTQTNG